MMKSVIVCGLIVAAFAVSSHAQLLAPIDFSKQADIGNQSAVLPTLDLNTRVEPFRGLSLSPLSGKEPNLKWFQTHQVDLNTTELSIINLRTMPQQNFTAQRSAVSDQMLVQPFVSTDQAPITDRQIKAYTPTGTEELKKQLSGTPK
jgi:hypothetical protein